MAIKNTNKRIGTATNLVSGGTYDLLMITYPDGFPESQLLFDIAETPRKITGIQKVAQTFLKILLTAKGSDLIYPNRGTSFSVYTNNANRYAAEPTLMAELIDAVSDAEGQTKAAMNSDRDPACQLSSATVAGMDTGETSVLMYVQLITNAGETAQVSIPFPQTDLV